MYAYIQKILYMCIYTSIYFLSYLLRFFICSLGYSSFFADVSEFSLHPDTILGQINVLWMYIYMYIYIYMHVCMNSYMYICINILKIICEFIYIYNMANIYIHSTYFWQRNCIQIYKGPLMITSKRKIS